MHDDQRFCREKKAVMAARSSFQLDRLHVELLILRFPLMYASEGSLRTLAKGY